MRPLSGEFHFPRHLFGLNASDAKAQELVANTVRVIIGNGFKLYAVSLTYCAARDQRMWHPAVVELLGRPLFWGQGVACGYCAANMQFYNTNYRT